MFKVAHYYKVGDDLFMVSLFKESGAFGSCFSVRDQKELDENIKKLEDDGYIVCKL